MLKWLSQNAATILVFAALVYVVSRIIVKMVKDKKSGKGGCAGCSGNCGSCNLADQKNKPMK